VAKDASAHAHQRPARDVHLCPRREGHPLGGSETVRHRQELSELLDLLLAHRSCFPAKREAADYGRVLDYLETPSLVHPREEVAREERLFDPLPAVRPLAERAAQWKKNLQAGGL
jgi:hypothetical protein